MRNRGVVTVLTFALIFYLLVLGFQGWSFILSGDPVPIAIGVAVWVLAALGGYVVWREIRFGQASVRLEVELRRAGELPADKLPTTAAGRPQREAADALFRRRQHEAEKAPSDWKAWYRLGLAYEACGDRKRAREALRHAIVIHDR